MVSGEAEKDARQVTSQGSITAAEWEELQRLAFGCTFDEYLEMYIAPLVILSTGWGSADPPIIYREPWEKSQRSDLYRRWFDEASVSASEAPSLLAAERFENGIPRLSPAFYQRPFIDSQDKLIALSPWHVLDRVGLGTWAKLNKAAKSLWGDRTGNQRFASTFGYLFEQWCQDRALEASRQPGFRGRVPYARSPQDIGLTASKRWIAWPHAPNAPASSNCSPGSTGAIARPLHCNHLRVLF